ncbi:MAG: M20/M25/M40 family metallo-hydrolase, partial [Ignavibacteriaceae bacterium]
ALHAKSNIDSIITSVVSKVEPDSVRHIIQSLQDFQTRFLLAENRFQIADWLYDRFASFGFTEIERDSFMCTTNYGGTATTLQVNIVATLPGTTRPDEIYIIGGHYDSFAYGSQMTNAPGADDNASGTSAALEFARVIMESGYQPEATIKFIAFAAEELMLFGESGCEHYAQKAYDEEMNIKLMINCDMISYNTLPIEQANVSINYYSGFTNLLNIAKDATNQFSLITGVTGTLNQYSDSYPFYEKGFPAIYFEENQFSPFYHTIDDKIENYDMEYCSEVIKSAGAMLLKYMDMNSPTSIQDEEFIINDFILEQNYPNPFNPTTTIKYSIPDVGTGLALSVQLKIYNVLGKEIATLVNEEKQPGIYEVILDASNLPSGTYFYKLQAGANTETKKLILIK